MTLPESYPEKIIREVVDACADCDSCRDFMETCLVFPELYRLIDKEKETGRTISPYDLRNLTNLCNFCALCPCYDIRAKIMSAKNAFIERDGLDIRIRTLENVENIGKICGAFPRLFNRILQYPITGRPFKKIMGIHEEREFPVLPEENFPAWAKRNNLHIRPKDKKRKAVYFAGCTARYFFPETARAAVEVLKYNGIEVWHIEQTCCGMPSMLEGDGKEALKYAEFNLNRLSEAVEAGYDIVCSCPTCGYMFKNIIKEGAYYSPEYQESVNPDDKHIKIPVPLESAGSGKTQFRLVSKSIYKNLLKDQGLFSSLNPLKRVAVSEHTYDLGEYLKILHARNEVKTNFAPMPIHAAYYPPCHMREQNIGRPYPELLSMIPEIKIQSVEGTFYCCGIAGIMGFKRDFYNASLEMGKPLMDKIKSIHPERIITDCLSCRLQFQHMTPYKVSHPIEILRESYSI